MQLNIEHRTSFAFDAPVDYTIQQLHLTPQDGFGQRVKHWEIRVNGKIQSHADAYGNLAHTLVVDGPHDAIDITAFGEVETGLDIPPAADPLPLQVYLRATPYTSMAEPLSTFARRFGKPGAGLNRTGVHALMRAVLDRVIPLETGADDMIHAADAFTKGHGSSQDLAHIFIACCRYLGVPARYVSGYRFVSANEKVAKHGWADVWVDGEWLSLDITAGQRANGMHVRLATGLDARDACPIMQVRQQAEATTSLRVMAHSMEQSQQ